MVLEACTSFRVEGSPRFTLVWVRHTIKFWIMIRVRVISVIVIFSIVTAIISIWIYTVCAPVVVLEYDPVRRSDAFACLQWVLEWSAWEVR